MSGGVIYPRQYQGMRNKNTVIPASYATDMSLLDCTADMSDRSTLENSTVEQLAMMLIFPTARVWRPAPLTY